MKNEKTFSVESTFDKISRVYDYPLIQAAFYGRIQDALLDSILEETPKSILDCGCGTGQLLVKLAHTWPSAKLHGLDISEKMLDKAAKKTFPKKAPQWHCASVYDIPLNDRSVDLVTNTISSHFYLDLSEALDEFYRVLKPGGKLVMANITNGILGHLPGPFKDQVAIPAQRFRSKDTWLEYFEMRGFKVLEVKTLIYPVRLFICQK